MVHVRNMATPEDKVQKRKKLYKTHIRCYNALYTSSNMTVNHTTLHRNHSYVLPTTDDTTAVQFAYIIQLRQPTLHRS